MKISLRVFTSVLFLAVLSLPLSTFSQPYSIKVEKTISFDSLSIYLNYISLEIGKGSLSLIECEQGVTGAVILANGRFFFLTDDSKPLHDSFTNLMLRFNPSDYETFIRPKNPTANSDTEALNNSLNVLKQSFNFMYHEGEKALIPDKGILGGVLFTNSLGKLIVNDGGEKPFVYSIKKKHLLLDGEGLTPVPIFKDISPNWNTKGSRIRMDDIWNDDGIVASGDNYFYYPIQGKGNTSSQRFDPNSIYFQSWFGMYIVKDLENRRYAFEDNEFNPVAILQLAVADQRAWLKNFAGFENPTVRIDTSFSITTSNIQIGNRNATKITGRIISNVDVGNNNSHSGLPKSLIVSSDLWDEYLESYSKISLDVVAFVIHNEETKESYVLYYNGVDFIDKKGKKHRTINDIQLEMESMILSFSIED